MAKWEYRVHTDLSEPELNTMGEKGFELVAVSFNPNDGKTYFYFRRSAA